MRPVRSQGEPPTIQETGYLLISLYLLFVAVAALTALHVVFAALAFVLLFLAGIVHVLSAGVHIEAERTLSRPSFTAGGRLEVEVTLTANRPLFMLEVYDELSDRLRIRKGSNYAFTNLLPRRSLTLRYEVESVVRGKEPVGPLVVRVRSPLSIFQRRVEVLDADAVRVFPKTVPVGEELLPRRSRLKRPGQLLSRHLGVGTEFYALREYLPGDQYSAINWRVTARMGRPVVNEYEAEARKPVAIFLDARAPTKTGYTESNALEQGVVAAASLAEAAIKMGHRVGLLVVGGEPRWVYPESGRRQYHRILDELLPVVAQGHEPLRHWAFMTRRMLPKQGGRIVLVTPDVADPTLVETVWKWVASGHEVSVVIPSFLGLDGADGEPDRLRTTERIAQTALRIRQASIAFNLRRLGAQVHLWDPKKSLGVVAAEPVEVPA